jgi:hypothetical protein
MRYSCCKHELRAVLLEVEILAADAVDTLVPARPSTRQRRRTKSLFM